MRSLINRVLYDWDATTRRRAIIAATAIPTGLVAALMLHLTTNLGWWASVVIISVLTGAAMIIKHMGYQRVAEVLWSARRRPTPPMEPVLDECDTVVDPKPIPPVHPGLPPDYDEEFHFLYVLEVAVPAMTLSSFCLWAFTRLPLPTSAWLLMAECLLVLIGPFLTYRRIILRKWRPVRYDPISNILVLHQRGSYWLLSIDSPPDPSPMANYAIETAKKSFIEQLFGFNSVTVYLNPFGGGKTKKIRRVRNVKALLAVQDGAARYKNYLQEKQAYDLALIAWQQRNPGLV